MNVQVVLGYNMSKTVSLANNTIVFFALIRAGLWEEEVSLLDYEEIDYQELYNLVDEQAVFGLVAAGLEHVVDVKVPKEIVLQFVGRTLQIEEQNKAMNSFIGVLVEKMRKADIYTLMVKGQGVVDLAIRSRINGYQNLLCPEAIVYHVGSATSGSRYNEFKVRLAARNNVWVVYKNIPIPLKIVSRPPLKCSR